MFGKISQEKLTKKFGNILWYDKKHRFGMPLSFTHYILTDEKLYIRTGLLNIHEDRIPLYRVIDKSLSFPFSERIFDCGTVTVHAKDKTCPMTLLKSIKDPRKVMKLLDEHVQRERDKYGVHGHDMVAAYGS